jgi:hypothetical protein
MERSREPPEIGKGVEHLVLENRLMCAENGGASGSVSQSNRRWQAQEKRGKVECGMYNEEQIP